MFHFTSQSLFLGAELQFAGFVGRGGCSGCNSL
jgi:hypothetical protein